MMNGYEEALYKMEPWALKMHEASAPIPIHFDSSKIGDYNRCLSIDERDTSIGSVKGKYCLVQIFKATTRSGQLPIINRWLPSVCIPDTCNAEEVTPYLQNKYSTDNDVISVISNENCHIASRTTDEYDLNSTIFMWALSLIVFLICVQTLYHGYIRITRKKNPSKSMSSFSLINNMPQILNTADTKDSIGCLDGLRTITMLWIVMFHRFMLSMEWKSLLFNQADFNKWKESPHSMYIINGTLAVDTFFVMGGSLVSYNFFKSNGRIIKNIPRYYFNRYLRCTASVAFSVWFIVSIPRHLPKGPNYQDFITMSNTCRDFWYTSFIYLGNYDRNHLCITPTWYLAVDMQMFVLSPILLIGLQRRNRTTQIAIFFVIGSMMMWCFHLAFSLNMKVLYSNPQMNDEIYSRHYYFVTHTRASSWLIGFLLGQYLHKVKSGISCNFNRVVVWILWLLSLTTLMTCLFAGHGTLRGPDPALLGNALHLALVRPAWCVAVSWIIYACVSNNGGIVNKFLSLPVFRVMGRLTFGIFITHQVWILYTISTKWHRSLWFDEIDMIFMSLRDYLVATVLSVALYLLVEGPVANLNSLLRKN